MEYCKCLIGLYTYLLLNLISCVTGLEFLVEPQDAVSLVNQPYWWHCQANTSPTPVIYTWRFGEADIPNDDVFPNGTFLIRDVKQTNEGEYTCVITSSGETISSKPVSLNIAALDSSFLINPKSATVDVKTAVTLECSINSYPAPKITWYLGDNPVTRGTVTMVTRTLSMLTIPSISYTDEGSYTCLATNSMLNQNLRSSAAVLSVQGQPEIVTLPQSLSVPDGRMAMFDCEAAANPPATLTWSFTSSTGVTTEIKDQSDYTVHPNGTLSISISVAVHAGTYTCTAKNTDGQDSKSAVLTLTGPPSVPVITSLSPDQQVTEGNSVILECQVTGNPIPQITWSKEGGALSNRVTYLDSSRLRISDVLPEDRGTYTCQAKNTEGTVTSSTKITVQTLPRFIRTPISVTVREVLKVELDCEASGNPQPDISWKTPVAEKINSSQGISGITVDNAGKLTINSALRQHHGLYTCIASNTIGSKSVTASVNVEGPPRFTESPVSQMALEGDASLTIPCRASGYPKPSFLWYRFGIGIPLKDGSKYQLMPEGDLKIKTIVKADQGQYICWVDNSIGRDNAVAHITVSIAPSFTVKPSDQSIQLNETAILHCNSTGDPVPLQKWQRNGASLVLANNMQQYPNSTLVIDDIEESQFGEYVCVSTNQVGEIQATGNIFIIDTAVFTQPPTNSTVTQGQKIIITCRASSETPPTYSWYTTDQSGKRDTMIDKSTTSRVYSTADGDLVVTKSEMNDEGWYICVATNNFGDKDSSPIYLDIQTPPAITATNSPQQSANEKSATLSCDVSGDPAPVLTWQSPQGVEITQETTRYTIVDTNLTIESVKTAKDGGNWKCKACNIISCEEETVQLLIEGEPLITGVISSRNDTHVNIECQAIGLPTPNVTYYIGTDVMIQNTAGHVISESGLSINVAEIKSTYQCVARNAHGFKTKLLTKPDTPSSPQIKKIESRQITLTWSDGIKAGLDVTRYNLQHKIENINKWIDSNLTIVNDEYIASELKPFTSYVFRVGITNVMDTGTFSEESVRVRTLADAPSEPRSVTVKDLINRITVEFDQAEYFNGKQSDVRYEVELMYRKPGTLDYVSIDTSSLTTNQNLFLEYTNISNGDYVVKVKSRNIDVNAESKMIEVKLTVQDKAPNFIPEIETITARSFDTIHITWNLSACDPCNPPITGYYIVLIMEDGSDGSNQTHYKVGRLVDNYTFVDLVELTQYTVHISAFNNVGTGTLSEPKTVWTLYEPFSVEAYKPTLGLTGWEIALIGGLLALLFLIIILVIICIVHQKKSYVANQNTPGESRFYLGHPSFIQESSLSDKGETASSAAFWKQTCCLPIKREYNVRPLSFNGYLEPNHTPRPKPSSSRPFSPLVNDVFQKQNPLFEEKHLGASYDVQPLPAITPHTNLPPTKPKRQRYKKSEQLLLSPLNQPYTRLTAPDGRRHSSSSVRQLIPDSPIDKSPIHSHPDPDYPVSFTSDYPDSLYQKHPVSLTLSNQYTPRSRSSSDFKSANQYKDVTLSELEALSQMFSDVEEDNFVNSHRDRDKPDVFYY